MPGVAVIVFVASVIKAVQAIRIINLQSDSAPIVVRAMGLGLLVQMYRGQSPSNSVKLPRVSPSSAAPLVVFLLQVLPLDREDWLT
jgi:hypothetical protein